MADTKMVSDVFELLKKLSVSGTDTEAAMEGIKIPASNVDNALLNPWEPNFIGGYKMTTRAGHVIDLDQIWDAYVGGENILLVGPSGCGKSTIAFHMLDRANEKIRMRNRITHRNNLDALKAGKTEMEPYQALPYPLAHFSCTKQTRVENLEGTLTFEMKDGVRMPVVILGAVTDAWSNGKTLILEEMDMPLPGVWAAAHQYFDGRTHETHIYVNGPQKLIKSDRFRVIATANTLGRGENQTDFADTEPQNTAFLNRFTYVVLVSWLPVSEEIILLIKSTGIRPDVAEKMVLAAGQSREAKASDAVDTAITTRDLKSWARECRREEKRRGISATLRLVDYWTNVAITSAYPTFLNRIVDQNTRDMYDVYLSIR